MFIIYNGRQWKCNGLNKGLVEYSWDMMMMSHGDIMGYKDMKLGIFHSDWDDVSEWDGFLLGLQIQCIYISNGQFTNN